MSYTTATFSRLDTNADGTPCMVIRYTGDAGEIPVEYSYVQDLTVMPSDDYIRGQAMERIRMLNVNKAFIVRATPAVGTILDTTTPLPVQPTPTPSGQYSAATLPFNPGATPQDVFTITGSATRIVRVLRLGLSSVQTTAGMNAWTVVKRSTANTGGTSTIVSAVPVDDRYPAPTATVRQYTAVATLGAPVGVIWAGRIPSPAPATALSGTIEQQAIADRTGVTLTGATDVLAWNLGGIALPAGLSVQAFVTWTEEDPPAA